MSKRQFKSQASSGRVGGGSGGFGSSAAGFASSGSSVLSYVQEPPDYSAISDSNVVVAFKNLSKKDNTTKAKALEDLQSFLITSDREVEDAIVEAWVRLFPRLSIDNARRVRQLAHQLNGQLCAKCGKRIAKHLPRLAGPWLAGTFDADRMSAKAAQDALSAVFSTPEKVQGLRKTFHEPIIEYCRDALLNETVHTLSDERSVSSDDAATTFARVAAGSIAVVASLLEPLSQEDMSKQSHIYGQILDDGKLWDCSTHADASVRRAAHRLIHLCAKTHPTLIEGNLKTASKAYVYKGLPSDQTTSAIDFAQTLFGLTVAFPSIWTEAYTGKKPAVSRLQQFLKHGSYSGSASFWEITTDLLRKLPPEVFPRSYDEISGLLLAARDGVSRKEERFTASAAWPTYFILVDLVTRPLSDEDAENLLEAFAMPPVNQYLHPSEESAKWSITGARSAALVARVAMIHRLPLLLERKWPHLAEKVAEAAKMSQPEQSKDFDKSQKHVASCGERWADLQKEFYAREDTWPSSVLMTFATANTKVLTQCIALLKTRNGKPYGAAAVIEQQLRACGPQLLQDTGFRQTLSDFVTMEVPKLMYSPSQRHLVRYLYALAVDPHFQDAFRETLASVLDADEPEQQKSSALHALFPMNMPLEAIDIARADERLQSVLAEQLTDSSQASLLADTFKLGIASGQTTDTVLTKLLDGLSLDGPGVYSSLTAFNQLATSNQTVIREFVAKDTGTKLLPTVLHLEQSQDDTIAEAATSLSGRLSTAMGDAAAEAKFGTIMHSLERTSSASLPIEAVLDLTDKTIGDDADPAIFKTLLPSIKLWQASIVAMMKPPKASISLLSSLGGAVHLVRSEASSTSTRAQYDAEGLSQALRLAIYLAKLLSRPGALQSLSDTAVHFLVLLNICVLLAEDSTSILDANGLWLASESRALEHEVMDFVADANAALKLYWDDATSNLRQHEDASFFGAVQSLVEQHEAESPMSYYAALVSAKAYENIFELHGYSTDRTKSCEDKLKAQKGSKDRISLVSLLVGSAQPLSGSQPLSRLFNELVSHLTDLRLESDKQRGLELLITLNAVLHTQEDIASSVQKTRVIFFVKHIIAWLTAETSPILAAEVCKSLAALLPTMSDTYGEHWSQIIRFLEMFWSSPTSVSDGTIVSETGVLLVHASLKLYAALERLAKDEEPNDDLLDEMKEHKGNLHNGLIELLRSSSGASDENHQPLMVTNEVLARELSRAPFKPVAEMEELFGLLYTPSHAIQGAAFDLLHKQIPAAQEQISFDAALDNKTAKLPDELLSLIIDAPTLDTLADASFDRAMPLALQGYLYSWRLLFDHFTTSSYRVKEDYVEQLKEGGYLPGLLSLVFDFLGHSRGRPIDASKFDVQKYIGDSEPSPEKDVQWLLSHLYYLALTNLPSMVKSYFLEIRSRQTSQAVESWTAKYISPLLVTASLQSVADWAEKSVKDDPDYENMSVKVGMRSKEINVSYLVDEQTMAIKVILPDTYPLNSAKVDSVNRVAVKEEKWRSWLLNCQGVITFSASLCTFPAWFQNGSITDGLSAWRKNVVGALKGQTECAICYSIISSEKQLPTKRCPTCKNLFHAGCLFKWFKTSNASTCPLCRNPFNFN
ncbi:E3 ubiquitin-protein ligase listerin [Fulvia fulva]|uniref:E3 ubiquitin-protein ligase listerin n=1 Tax=Passalora fulva TaxID=5499 RepID=A0A9Q8PFN0_PASFU|nr:E3 ubiquitin-protein ligase listerin [Fulvia fulva]UJO21556.1 E3 ubiquitin-protein ligase listerin [Fulvia fulva]